MTDTNGEAKRKRLNEIRRQKIRLRTLRQNLTTAIDDFLNRDIEELDTEELRIEKEVLVPPSASIVDDAIKEPAGEKKEEKNVPSVPD